MNPPPESGPGPEELAAYLDGALDDAARARVAAWLDRHPDAAAEIEEQRGLLAYWRASAPPEPSAAKWEALRGRIQAALPRQTGQRTAVAWAGALAAAAAVVAAVLTLTPRGPERTEPEDEAIREAFAEPIAVAARGDVDILSVAGDDVPALVVGDPPLRDPLVLARANDITVENVEPDADGKLPGMTGMDGEGTPMIVASTGPPTKTP